MKSFSSLPIFIIFISTLLFQCKTHTPLYQLNTVQGEISIDDKGWMLSHEHIMSNFGKDISEASVYDTTLLFKQVIPYLKNLKALGVSTIFDCTTAHFGRRIDLLNTISSSSGIHIVTNTGYYGAADDRYIPKMAYASTAESISKIWIDEFENGIEGTDIRPGFIKLAFDDGQSPSEIDTKLFEAGILTHLQTGLTIAAHTGKNIEAIELQMSILDKYNVAPSAWIWTHANKMTEDAMLIELAMKGAWISLDGVKANNIDEYIKRLKLFKQKKLLHKVLISHDGNGFPRGGAIRPFDAIFKSLTPALLEQGFSDQDIDQLLITNPQNAFKIRIRKK